MKRRDRIITHPNVAARLLLVEAIEGITQRPGRALLTAAGTLLGVAVLVTVLGITATATAQIGSQFTLQSATQIRVEQQLSASRIGTLEFGIDGDERVKRIDGVTEAGMWWIAGATSPRGQTSGAQVTAVSAGLLKAADASVSSGRLFDTAAVEHRLPVAVVGPLVARDLGITDLSSHPAVTIGGRAFVVIGVLDGVERLPELLTHVLIPHTTALEHLGQPQGDNPPQMLVRVRLGAALVVADQLTEALRPGRPGLFEVHAPPEPSSLRDDVDTSLNGLFLALAGVSLLVGMTGIANTTFVSVMERVPEIGLRRALGAQPIHIATQFLIEAAILGLLGGLAGAALGTIAVVCIALINQWTAVVPAGLTVLGPASGLVVGLIAGLYPAWRASKVEPLEALRA